MITLTFHYVSFYLSVKGEVSLQLILPLSVKGLAIFLLMCF